MATFGHEDGYAFNEDQRGGHTEPDAHKKGTLVFDRHPPPHAKYLVRRDGYLVTATPCYGMHEPWWVVRTMDGEADPVDMKADDVWWPLPDLLRHLLASTKGTSENLG